MSINKIILLISIGLLFSAKSPIFNFGKVEGTESFHIDLVGYEIYKINNDGMDGEQIEKGGLVKAGLFGLGSKHKVKFDFSSGNHRIKFIYNENNNVYGASLDLKKEWFVDLYASKTSELPTTNNEFSRTTIEVNKTKYPYEFTITLKKLHTIFKGYVYTTNEDNEKKPVEGARISLNSETKLFAQTAKMSAWVTTLNDGRFEYKILMKNKINFTPGIVITKNGYHVTEQNYSKDDINNSLITDERAIYIERRDGRGNWQDCSYPLEYVEDCDECACIDQYHKWYPRQGVCDIYEDSCSPGETFVFLNKETDTDSLSYGKMEAKCIKSEGSSDTFIKSNEIDYVLLSIELYRDGRSINGAEIEYKKYKNKDGNKTLGKTNDYGILVVDNYQIPEGQYAPDETLASMGLTDLDPSMYFFLNKRDVRSGKHKFIINESNGKITELSIKNNGKDNFGNSISLKRISSAVVRVNLSGEEINYTFKKNDAEEIESAIEIKNSNEDFFENSGYNQRCDELAKEINSWVQNCEWEELDYIIEEALDVCIVESDTRLLSNIISYYYHRIKQFNEERFLNELINDNRKRNKMPTFAKLDALHKSYDIMIGSIHGTLTNYELAYHYYRKFLFYFYYNEFMTIHGEEINQRGINTNIWQYNFGCNQEEANFRRLGEERFYRNIREEAKEALDQFDAIKQKSIGEKIPEFNKLDLMKRNLDVIIMEQKADES